MYEQVFLNGAPVAGLGDLATLEQAYSYEKKLLGTTAGAGLAVGAVSGALLGHRVKKGTGAVIGAVVGGFAGGAGGAALRAPAMRRARAARDAAPLEPPVGFGQGEVVAPTVAGPSPWVIALTTSVVGTAAGWALEEIRDRIQGRRR